MHRRARLQHDPLCTYRGIQRLAVVEFLGAEVDGGSIAARQSAAVGKGGWWGGGVERSVSLNYSRRAFHHRRPIEYKRSDVWQFDFHSTLRILNNFKCANDVRPLIRDSK